MKPPSIERDSVVLMEDPDPNERQSVKIAKIVGCALLSLIPVCLIGRFSVGWFANPWICLSMTGVCWAVAALCHYLAKKRRNALLLLSVLINAAGCGFGIGALYLGYGAVPLDSSLSLGALGFAGAIVLFGLLYFLIPRKLVSDILCGLLCLMLAIVFLIFWLKGNDFCRVAFLLDVWLAGFFLALAVTVDTSENAWRTTSFGCFGAAFSVLIIVALVLLALLSEGGGCDSCDGDCCDCGNPGGSAKSVRRKRR